MSLSPADYEYGCSYELVFSTNCVVSNLSIVWLVKLQERGVREWSMNNTTKLNSLISLVTISYLMKKLKTDETSNKNILHENVGGIYNSGVQRKETRV